VIGDFRMPWEGKENKKLAKGIPPAPLWAATPEGVNQIGSIYTVQGFEFDYIGVIFGNDLVYDPEKKEWVGKPENSADPMLKKAKDFTKYVKNVYRVLLTRGMKGCYVYFLDKNTENFFKSRIKMD
ncbi:MAG: DNA/RNA helicase domain-containing protein, partial [Candidatus Aenigmatarchaeota archaeon]